MIATFAERKLHTIELLTKLEDEELLELIEQLLVSSFGSDWTDNLSESEKNSIGTGMQQLDAGEGEPLEAFKKRMSVKFP